MGKCCCAVGCTSRFTKLAGIPFYRFPNDPERRQLWINAVCRKIWTPNEYSWICGRHFISGCKSNDRMSPDYVPSIFDYVKSPEKRRLSLNLDRYERTVQVKRRRVLNDARYSCAVSLLELSESGNNLQYCEPHTGVASSTAMTIRDIDELESKCAVLQDQNRQLVMDHEQLKLVNQKLLDETEYLKKQNSILIKRCEELQEESRLAAEMSAKQLAAGNIMQQASLQNDDSKVRYYTGLPNFAVLLTLFNYLVNSRGVEFGNRSALDLFQQFMVVLMKLRLNLGDQDLAYRFNVSQSTISRYVAKWINVMYVYLSTST